jgi:4-hydroxy-3-methylbut-2-en-1-yl diphosphate reductase
MMVCTPLWVERLALGRLKGIRVVHTGMGPRRSGAAEVDGPVLVAGVAGALSTKIRPGDVVVASQVRGNRSTVDCPSATALADSLRRLGLRVHVGPITSVARPADGGARRTLSRSGAIAVDMESAWLAPHAVVRTIVDTPDHPLWRIGTVYRGVKALRALRRAAPAIAEWCHAQVAQEVS